MKIELVLFDPMEDDPDIEPYAEGIQEIIESRTEREDDDDIEFIVSKFED